MKYSERFFQFPIRIYDRFSAEKAEEKEKNFDIPMEGDWTEGQVKLPHDDIKSWGDFFDSEEGISKVESDGFSSCVILTQSNGVFIATITKEEFEFRLDEYVAKYEAWEDSSIESLLSRAKAIQTK